MFPKMLKSCSNVEERRFTAASRGMDDAGFSPCSRISRQTLAAMALVALASAWPFSAQAQKSAAASVTADLPAGPMQAQATTACLERHEARIVLQQRLSKAPRTQQGDNMVKRSAVVDSA